MLPGIDRTPRPSVHPAGRFPAPAAVKSAHLAGRNCPPGAAGLAQTLGQLGRVDEAFADFRELLRLNPNDNQCVRYLLLSELVRVDRGRLRRVFEDAAWRRRPDTPSMYRTIPVRRLSDRSWIRWRHPSRATAWPGA